jgi:acetyltransferase-like isoleucine patch superfamily enzyme
MVHLWASLTSSLRRAAGSARRRAHHIAGSALGLPDERKSFQTLLDDGIIVMGTGSYGRPHVHYFEPAGSSRPHVVVGRYCSVAAEVTFVVNGEHRLDWTTTFPISARFGLPIADNDGHPKITGPVTVGNDVWIGHRALLLGGVTVGDGAVVGAGAVVARDVRPFAIVVGNPAREVRRRFDDEVVDRLLELRWWDLDESAVRSIGHLLCAEPELDTLARELAHLRSGLSRTSS